MIQSFKLRLFIELSEVGSQKWEMRHLRPTLVRATKLEKHGCSRYVSKMCQMCFKFIQSYIMYVLSGHVEMTSSDIDLGVEKS